nr:MAG TPA_asm: hypothetical protein [Bacteriophage sp.]
MCRTFSRTTLFCITRMPNKWLSTYYTVVVFTLSYASTCYTSVKVRCLHFFYISAF